MKIDKRCEEKAKFEWTQDHWANGMKQVKFENVHNGQDVWNAIRTMLVADGIFSSNEQNAITATKDLYYY